MTHPRDLPPHDQLADDADELGWDREQHGRMRDYATGPEGEPETVPYEPGADPYLAEQD